MASTCGKCQFGGWQTLWKIFLGAWTSSSENNSKEIFCVVKFWRPYSFDNVFILLSHSNDNLGGYIILCSNFIVLSFSSVQVSHSVVSDSLRPHELQHARPPCPSPSPGVHSDSRPSSQWCHPAISASVVPFSFCPQSLPASESFPMSQLFSWGGQSTGVSALASFLPKKSQGQSPSEWTGWMSLQSQGLSRVFSNTTCHIVLCGETMKSTGKDSIIIFLFSKYSLNETFLPPHMTVRGSNGWKPCHYWYLHLSSWKWWCDWHGGSRMC